MTYSQIYREGTEILSGADIAEAALDSRLLLEFICKTDRNTLYVNPDMPVSDNDYEEFLRLIKLRATHVPLAHIVGTRDFMGLTFKVNEHVLIPRQDTEILVEEAMRYTFDGMKVLDICTGSGCIILSLMHYKNNLDAVGIDISEAALAVAKENAKLLLEPQRGQIAFYQGDLYEALPTPGHGDGDTVPHTGHGDGDTVPRIRHGDGDSVPHTGHGDGDTVSNTGHGDGDTVSHTGHGDGDSVLKFDVIVSNPPYIRDDVIQTLMPEVRDFDPYIALSGGGDGLDFYRKIIEGAPKYLVKEGRIFLEIGHDQAADVAKLLEDAGFSDICIVKDYAGLDRVACAKL